MRQLPAVSKVKFVKGSKNQTFFLNFPLNIMILEFFFDNHYEQSQKSVDQL